VHDLYSGAYQFFRIILRNNKVRSLCRFHAMHRMMKPNSNASFSYHWNCQITSTSTQDRTAASALLTVMPRDASCQRTPTRTPTRRENSATMPIICATAIASLFHPNTTAFCGVEGSDAGSLRTRCWRSGCGILRQEALLTLLKTDRTTTCRSYSTPHISMQAQNELALKFRLPPHHHLSSYTRILRIFFVRLQ
jgi:hypothetical protein